MAAAEFKEGDQCPTAVVPAYDSRATLARTLDALLGDNGERVKRVVVVASGEGASRVRDFERPRVEVVVSCRRLSAGLARNLGAQIVFGRNPEEDLVLFVDADCAPAPGAVARMMERLAEGGDAVSARLLRDGGGVVAWLRHALEFKEAEAGHALWFVPSATLLCRRRAFEKAGGFPDMWPGEDLVFCHRLHRAGSRVAIAANARSLHLHPRSWLALFRHQFRLGATSASARLQTGMPGSWFARRPLLSPLLFAGRAVRGLCWYARRGLGEFLVFLLLFPVYLAALAVWTAGFAAASRPGADR